jgi:hypothetical protein
MKRAITAVAVTVAFALVNVHAATGIFGGYVTVGGTKYKSSSIYAGPEPLFGSTSLGSFNVGQSLIFSAAETFTFQNSDHSTFEGALAYRVRLSSALKSTNPTQYSFQGMGNGVPVGVGNPGDEKFEFTGASINLLTGISTPSSPTVYNIDIIHKVGAWEGGNNFERLASISNANPGSTAWADVNAFTAEFTVIPEPSTYALLGLGALVIFRHFVRCRRRS